MTSKNWEKTVEESQRKAYYTGSSNLRESLEQGLKAGNAWGQRNESESEGVAVDKGHNEHPPLQEDRCPVMVHCDVVGLYPNLHPINVAKITADAIRKSKVQFRGVDYCTLAIYLVLVLGESTMRKVGLHDCIPTRKAQEGKKTSNYRSLCSNINRDERNWDFSDVTFSKENK